MGKPFTEEDAAELARLEAKGERARSIDEEHRLKALQARAELEDLRRSERRRKSGRLHKPAIVVFLLGLGACGVGASQGSGGLMGAGAVLLFVSSLLNGLNDKLTGS